jgi:quercetin dioxygenase-like cupin family protein
VGQRNGGAGMTVEGISHHFSDGLYAKQMRLAAGFMATSHVHKYSHLSILAQGEVVVVADGKSEHYLAPACIEIKAGVTHEIHALKDVVWWCVHQVDGEYDERNIDEVLIKECEKCLG